MKHIKTVRLNTIDNSKNSGCGNCQSSCQSACKTSCTVGNQLCERQDSASTFIRRAK